MNCTNKFALLCTGLLCCTSVSAHVVVPADAVVQSAQKTDSTAAKQVKSSHVLLQNEGMKTINTVFGTNPLIMVSIIKASRTASKKLHELPKIQDADVAKNLQEVLHPVESFLGMIEGPVGNFIEPLIIESFGAELYAKSILGAMTKQKTSPLLFLRARVQTKNDLRQFCQEFTKFFNDLHNSLSPEVRTIVGEEMKRLIAQSQAKPASR